LDGGIPGTGDAEADGSQVTTTTETGPFDADGTADSRVDSDGVLADVGVADTSADGASDLDSGASTYDLPPEAPGTWLQIESGTFTMGSPPTEEGRDLGFFPDQDVHFATVTWQFWIMDTEITQGQFEAVMGYNDSIASACGPTCPVENVYWDEIAAYANALSANEGLPECYACAEGPSGYPLCTPDDSYAEPQNCPGYRLPLEIEWEYAARAGTTTATYNGDLDRTDCQRSRVLEPIAWYCFNASEGPQPVGELAANRWGLYDMLGSVAEWSHGAESSGHVVRGGAFSSEAFYCRAAARYVIPSVPFSASTNHFLGGRLVRTVL
jgi:formylglycine-generating enzyme required for sulfatase activity